MCLRLQGTEAGCKLPDTSGNLQMYANRYGPDVNYQIHLVIYANRYETIEDVNYQMYLVIYIWSISVCIHL